MDKKKYHGNINNLLAIQVEEVEGRRVIYGDFEPVDYTAYQKTPEERLRLKMLKAESKKR